MPDIFISYARADEALAARLAERLRAAGYEVWRDDQLPVHRAYSEEIEEQLKAAKAVVVLWSETAIRSQWVRAEADTARNRKTLIQATLDGTMPPLPFNQIQCADLSQWATEPHADGGLRKVLKSVAALVGESKQSAGRAVPGNQISICVLPFANMSGDADQEYFSDGISEDITTDLSKISALAVTARNTAFTYKGQPVNAADTARKLGVSHLLEGSVRLSGQRVRITAQLIDGATGDHLWAERYDRDLTDIFAIQDEISSAIVAALKLRLLPAEKEALTARGTTNVEAYNLYLMARNYWVTGNYGDFGREQRVIRLCRGALELDPDYAQAWALLALAQISLRFYCDRIDGDAGESAARALAIDPTIAEAYAVRARLLAEDGKFEEANAEISRALELGPVSWEVNREAARVARTQKKIAEAKQFYQRAVAIIDSDYHSWTMFVVCCRALNDQDGVMAGARMMVSQSAKALQEDPSNGAALGINAGGNAILGNRDKAMETIRRAMLINPENVNMRYNFACVLSGYLNDHDSALELLGPVLEEAGEWLVKSASIDPDLTALQGDPRFIALLAKARERCVEDASSAPSTARYSS